MANLAMAAPHIMGTDTRELIEAMAAQRLQEGPTPLLQAPTLNCEPLTPTPKPQTSATKDKAAMYLVKTNSADSFWDMGSN